VADRARALSGACIHGGVLRHVWYGLSSGLVAGLLVGLIEAISILAGINTGEYTALLFAALLYSVAGAGVGVGVGVVLAVAHRLLSTSPPVSWAAGFAAVFVGLSWTILRDLVQRTVYNARPLELSSEAVLAVGCLGAAAFLIWFGSILVQRTPLKILLRPRGTAAFYAVVVVLSAVFSLTPGHPLAPLDKHQPPDLAEHPNVLLLVVDALRPDHLGAYGSPDGLSPSIDRLAAEGVVFEEAFGHAAWTRPAMASLLTGRLPQTHGTDRRGTALPSSIETVAELLSRRTYLTIGLPNDRDVSRAFNFHQGFDRFSYTPPRLLPWVTESVQRLSLYGALRRLHIRSGAPQHVVAHYRPAEDILGAARQEIAAAGGQRWFLWAHLKEPHAPYFHRPLNGRAELLPDRRPPADRASQIRARYADEVRWVDQRIGEFIGWLEDSGQLEDTIVIVTADHGTELLDHGSWGHGETLYDEILRIPLVIRLPGREHAGLRAGWQVRQIDIAPTIAAQVGAPPLDGWQGRDLLGPGLEAWLVGEAPAPRSRPVLAGSSYRGTEMSALRADGWKFIRTGTGHPRRLQPEELFRVAQDPGERQSLVGREGATQARMSSQLRTSLEHLQPQAPPPDVQPR